MDGFERDSGASVMAKSNQKEKPQSDESGETESTPMTFEESMAGLQQIVSDLEDNSLGLEASLAQFERGIRLLRNCHAFLEKAEQKIEILTGFKANGEPVTAPFDATPTGGNPEAKTLF
jgi:exodeoxyribonuclease VII small subunit